MSKRALIVFLAGVSLCLLACLVLTTYSPPQAVAQTVTGSGKYILISAEAQINRDVIYLVDLRRKQLHAFYSDVPIASDQPLMVRWCHTRDLTRDFRVSKRGAK